MKRVLKLKIAMAQINPTMGDFKENFEKIKEYTAKAVDKGAKIIIFPELAMTGYPPLDLVPPKDTPRDFGFVRKNLEILEDLVRENFKVITIIGFIDEVNGNLYNAAAVLSKGKLLGKAYKRLLPTYDVFDEHRYFELGEEIEPIEVEIDGKTIRIGVEVCEDLWDEKYRVKVTEILAERGSDIIINISASPFYAGKGLERLELLSKKSGENETPIFYVNMVGGQDELVFDGQSLAVDKTGKLIAVGKQFEEDLVFTDLSIENGVGAEVTLPEYNREEEIFNALVLGVRDYFKKTGFKKAVIGLSSGIDSSLTAVIAKEALGRGNVLGVYMPSRYSSETSRRAAEELAKNLGINFKVIPIEPFFERYQEALAAEFAGLEEDVTEENIQARIRGNILMALSNKFGYLVLGTGNKTELALGYCTLYGDMAAGFGVISDVSKLEVYALARYYNRRCGREVIPKSSIEKAPSAELKEDQVDPFNYDIVSPLVDEIIENRKSKKELIEMGYDQAIVEDILRRIRRAEYKRRQAAPGIKITRKAFGIGWKMPIVNKYDF